MRPLLALGVCLSGSVPSVVGLARQSRHTGPCSLSSFSSTERPGQRRALVGWHASGGTPRCRTAASNGSGNGSGPSSTGSQQPSERSAHCAEEAPDRPPAKAAAAAGSAGQSGITWPSGRWLAFGGSVAVRNCSRTIFPHSSCSVQSAIDVNFNHAFDALVCLGKRVLVLSARRRLWR